MFNVRFHTLVQTATVQLHMDMRSHANLTCVAAHCPRDARGLTVPV